jgi:tetratricopeptide (TPR) repeat protein
VDPIEPKQFVELVSPLLQQKDLHGLCSLLKTRWEPDQIRNLLSSKHNDARKVALLALALVGPKCCIDELTAQLKDPDPMINELAEHALWCVWLRSGKGAEANQLVCQGTDAMNRRDFAGAIELFSRAIHHDPDFAEAYNQRAIGYYLVEDFQKSIGDCKRTVRRMPCHFGMGHSHTHLEQIPEAIASYEKALEINPHLACVRESIEALKKRV